MGSKLNYSRGSSALCFPGSISPGFSTPCFIDNAESINELLPMASQRVDLIVSTDKELKIETE